VLRDYPRHRGLADAIEPGHGGVELAVGDDAVRDHAPRGRVQLLAPPAQATLGGMYMIVRRKLARIKPSAACPG